MPEIKLTAIVPNQKGLHARAAAQIVSLSSQFPCETTIAHGDKEASSLSLIKLLTLDAPQGSKLSIKSNGEQSEQAAKSIAELVQRGFGE
ncbi:MAG: HPr family phosphocarrier protein [Kangiellaceae bacterium]|nr:HPr family phosphocarrier protein [Kangiellaceae bacterium]